MQGWIKTHRQLLGSVVFNNPDLLKVWMWCLLKASHKEHKILVGYQEEVLHPGEFIFGRKKAAVELGYSEPKTYRLIKRLELLQNVTIKPNNKYSVITIVNWELYQGNGVDGEQQIEYQTNNKRTTNEQQMNTNKNDKNVKNGDKEYIKHFEKLWKLYPNKKGKGQIKDSHKKKIFLLGDEFERCISRYKDDKEDWKQWQNGSTFFKSGYVDFLDANYEKAEQPKEQPVKSFNRKTKFHPKESRVEKYTPDELNKVADRKRKEAAAKREPTRLGDIIPELKGLGED